MSVVIPGMEMPKNCWDCPCFFSEGWLCNLDDECREDCDGRPDWCPLVELPEKHGRLIDADALYYDLSVDDEDIYVKHCLEDAPTVLEAEYGDKDDERSNKQM